MAAAIENLRISLPSRPITSFHTSYILVLGTVLVLLCLILTEQLSVRLVQLGEYVMVFVLVGAAITPVLWRSYGSYGLQGRVKLNFFF
jgi:hypothetical protein